MKKPEKFDHWHDEYEWHSANTAESLSTLSEAQLLERIRTRQFDSYFAIWRAVRKKGTLINCAPALLNVLRQEAGRNHMLQSA